jgi:hypothetical protein
LSAAWLFHWPAGWLGNPYFEAILQGAGATGTVVVTAIALRLVPEVETVLAQRFRWWPRRL